MDESKLRKLEKLLELADQDYATPEDVGEAIRQVVEAFKKVTDKVEGKLISSVSALSSADSALSQRISATDNQITAWAKDLQRQIREIELTPGKDAEEIDKEQLIKDLLARIELPAPIKGDDGSPDSAEDIRNKLELLDGDERLDKSAIKGLEEFFKENTRRDDDGITRIIGANKPLWALNDVNLTGLQVGNTIVWDGVQWVPGSGGGGSGTVDSVVGSTYIGVNSTDPANPVVSLLTGIPTTYIGGGTIDNTEFGYLNGVTSNIQTQLNTLSVQDFWDRNSGLGYLYPQTLTDRLGVGTNTPAGTLEVMSGSTSSANTAFRVDDSTGRSMFEINDAGYVGMSTAPSTTWKLDFVGQYFQMGSDTTSNDLRTNNTNKLFGIVTPHYANASNPIWGIGVQATLANNTVYIGGGVTAGANAATQILFATNSSVTGGVGSVRMTLSNTLLRIGSGDATTTPAEVVIQGPRANGGTNIAGTQQRIITGLATGSAASGDFLFQTGVPLVSGTTIQTATTRMTIKGDTGNVIIASLTNGLVKSTTGTLSNATAGTDYQAPITLTTTGTSGAATFIANVLNIPNYASGGGTGDVVGPASATDNAIARFDTTTGKLIQNSAVTIADTTGVIAGSQGLTLTGVSGPSYVQGGLIYDTDNESLTFFNNDSAVALQIGQEEWIKVVNNTGSTIANGKAVYLSGASAGLPTIALARANAAATTIGAGLTTESIANGATGYVTWGGLVRGIDTSAFAAGATVYIDATTAGSLTTTAPTSPNYRYRIGIVGTSNAVTGTIHVTPSTAALGNGTANQVFGMNAAGTAQEVKTLGSTTSIAAVNAANSITFTRAALTGVITAASNVNTTAFGSFASSVLATALTDETGTGSVVFSTSPTLVTPILGAATATSLAASGTVTGSNLSGTNTGDQTITLTGDVTGSGTGSFATTIKSSVALAGSPTTTTQSPGDNTTKIATTAFVTDAVATGTIGLLDYRGAYDASTNLYPATGGSGVLGAVLKGDFWICSVAGTLGGVATTPGDLIISLVDTPGQTSTNWDVIAHNLGSYVTSVTGTTNRITSSGGATPVINISATFEALLGKVANRIDQNNAATTSAQLASIISDETGTGALVFATSPSLTTPSFSSIINTGTLTLPTATDTLVGRGTTDTLTNKRLTARVGTTASSGTPTINTDNVDAYSITAQAAAITSFTTNLSGTPTDFQKLLIRIKDNGTARAITWGASFEAKGVSLPTTTVISKVLTVGFIWDSVTSKWGCVASAQEA